MNLAVILGSTRPGRAGERVAHWVQGRLALQPGVTAELLDLREFSLPFLDEEKLPSQIRGGEYKSEAANRWFESISEMDGFVIVTPEYNHGYPAVLKNALDYLAQPWADKPVAFVSYSSGAVGGARVVEQLRQVVANLKLVAISEALHLGKVKELLDDSGALLNEGPFDGLLDSELAQLVEWAALMKGKREGNAGS